MREREGDQDLPRAVGKLQALIRIPTVSYREPERMDTDAVRRVRRPSWRGSSRCCTSGSS